MEKLGVFRFFLEKVLGKRPQFYLKIRVEIKVFSGFFLGYPKKKKIVAGYLQISDEWVESFADFWFQLRIGWSLDSGIYTPYDIVPKRHTTPLHSNVLCTEEIPSRCHAPLRGHPQPTLSRPRCCEVPQRQQLRGGAGGVLSG